MRRVRVITTGGTIAMQEDTEAGGAVPRLSAGDLAAALPPGLAEVQVEEHCNLPSAHFTLDVLWGLRGRVARTVVEPEVDGVVITHGTDTMEESAYLLDLTAAGKKPIVLTGAMRTASEIGYEGLANLSAAVRVAASPQARGLGALVVMNDEIHTARYVTKMHTQSLDTFRSLFFGPLGRVDGDQVAIGQRVERRMISCPALEPRVALVKVGVGTDDGLLRWAISQGAQGVVIEALGGGRLPPWWMPAVAEAVKRGVAVVIASRCPSGRVYDRYGYRGAYRDLRAAGVLFAEELNGQKARIRLMVVLGEASSGEEVRRLWEV